MQLLSTMEEICAAGQIEGYALRGHKFVRVREGFVTCFVAQNAGRGRSWLRFQRRSTPHAANGLPGWDGWYVTAYKTRRAALEGAS